MRALAASFLIASAVGCHCSPAEPSAVTLRLKNTSSDAIFVDDTDGKLGLTVQRNVGGIWYGFGDILACACQACDLVCDCSCDGGSPSFVREVRPGETLERSWNGVVQVQALASCGGLACLRPENAPTDEGFNLSLCYQLQVSGINFPDGGRLAAQYPKVGESCTDKGFAIVDGVVEISPPRGTACAEGVPCPGPGELCLGGSCTASCPANGFPTLGAGWALRIADPDDQGFFASARDGGRTTFTGTGTLSSVVFNSGTMTLRLLRTGLLGEPLKGAVYVTLPPGVAAPLIQGTTVSVRLIDGSTQDNPENKALLIRGADGGLLFAADHAQQGTLLTAADTAPFAVTFATSIRGCRTTECGKQLFYQTRFKAPPIDTLLDPGKSALLTVSEGAFRALNVSNASFASTSCKLFDIRPYAVWREQAP